MTTVGMEWVFYTGALAAFSGVGLFVAMLARKHGVDALRTW